MNDEVMLECTNTHTGKTLYDLLPFHDGGIKMKTQRFICVTDIKAITDHLHYKGQGDISFKECEAHKFNLIKIILGIILQETFKTCLPHLYRLEKKQMKSSLLVESYQLSSICIG